MDELFKLIPDIYYDLIGRVIPGAILIVSVLPLRAWQQFLERGSFPLSAILLFGIFSYVTGLIIDAFSVTVEGFVEYLKGRKTLYEELDSIANEKSAKQFTKLVAEITLLRVLLTGWIILGLNWIFPIFKFPFYHNLFFYFMILVFLITSYLKWYRCTRERIKKYNS